MPGLASNFSLRSWLVVAFGGALALFALFGVLAEEVVMDGRYWLDRTTSLEIRQYRHQRPHGGRARGHRTGRELVSRHRLWRHFALALLATTMEHGHRNRRYLRFCQGAGNRVEADLRARASVGGAAFAGCRGI